MTSREAMKAHVKNGFPIAPRFSVIADPEAAASSPIVRFVDKLAKRNLLHTWQRPALPQYTAIERVLGEEIHNALTKAKPDLTALKDASDRIARLLDAAAPRSAIEDDALAPVASVPPATGSIAALHH
jgi:multiple sugar transport system substrate-binding protein